ncbi:MAG: hypothetical protein JXA67_06930 [Micromonosporaceae bacterium]|nr:hypothetical protein [Micromonosporaceae bacterium]
MATKKINKIPTPLYAAAGAGDLAYEKLRELPQKVTQLRGRVAELRPVVEERVRRRAHAAQGKATAVFGDLVARGERVVRTARTDRPSEQPTTEVKAVTAAKTAQKKAPTKRTRPTDTAQEQ